DRATSRGMKEESVGRQSVGGDPPLGEADLFAAPPADSKVQVVEATPERLVFYVPARGMRGAGVWDFFVLNWNGFIGLVTFAYISGLLKPAAGQAPPPILLVIPILAPFWAVGLGMLYCLLLIRFERLLLSLDQIRFVQRRILFGRERNQTISLGES